MVEADRDVSFLGTLAVAPKSRMAARGIPLPSPSPLLLPPPQPSFVQRLVVALMPPHLILSTLPPPLNAQPRPIEAPSPLVHWCLSSRLPLVRRLVVASPVVACLRLASHFVGQPPHASILDPSSLFIVHASWLSRRISLHRLRLSTRRSFLLISPSLYLIVACEWCVRQTGLDCCQCRHCHPIPPAIPVGSGGRSGVAPPPAQAKHVARLVHWSQHQQRTAVVTPSVIIVDVLRVELVPHRIAFPSPPSLECCPFVPVSVVTIGDRLRQDAPPPHPCPTADCYFYPQWLQSCCRQQC